MAYPRALTPAQHYAVMTKLRARYMPECRNQTRVLRSQGKLNLAPHHDEAYARALAEMRAGDALRHGIADDILNSGPASPCVSGDAPAASPPCAGASKFMPGLDRLLSNIIQHGKAA